MMPIESDQSRQGSDIRRSASTSRYQESTGSQTRRSSGEGRSSSSSRYAESTGSQTGRSSGEGRSVSSSRYAESTGSQTGRSSGEGRSASSSRYQAGTESQSRRSSSASKFASAADYQESTEDRNLSGSGIRKSSTARYQESSRIDELVQTEKDKLKKKGAYVRDTIRLGWSINKSLYSDSIPEDMDISGQSGSRTKSSEDETASHDRNRAEASDSRKRTDSTGSSGKTGARPSSASRRHSLKEERSKRDLQQARERGFTEREWKRLNAQEERARKELRRLYGIVGILAVVACIMVYFVYNSLIRSHDYELSLAYDRNRPVYGISTTASDGATAEPFARDLCVTNRNVNTDLLTIDSLSAGLFDLSENEVLYAKDIFTTRAQASVTKIMTAIVALKYGNPNDMVTITRTALDVEYGSSVCDVHVGDKLTLKQLLYGLLIASGNDAAMMIAEYVGGSVDHFVQLMNEEALALGATRTHFMNPHGLDASGHYTCVYDIYLIFREAMNYTMFMDIINRKNFYAEYTDADGKAVAVTWESTNYYFIGLADSPDNVIIYGGKTGTTDDAGCCLALMTKDFYGNPYLSVILHAEDKSQLYEEMNRILSLIGNSYY